MKNVSLPCPPSMDPHPHPPSGVYGGSRGRYFISSKQPSSVATSQSTGASISEGPKAPEEGVKAVANPGHEKQQKVVYSCRVVICWLLFATVFLQSFFIGCYAFGGGIVFKYSEYTD